MNISAVPAYNLNSMANFSAQKQIIHRNSDEDFWIETVDVPDEESDKKPVEEPECETVLHRNSDEDWYIEKVNKKSEGKKAVKQAKPEKVSIYEKGPNGVMGVWTRDGGGYAFFTPAKDIEAKLKEANATAKKPYEETPEEYKQRKLYSPEWSM